MPGANPPPPDPHQRAARWLRFGLRIETDAAVRAALLAWAWELEQKAAATGQEARVIEQVPTKE